MSRRIPGWHEHAACQYEGARRAREGKARAICAGCPARQPCLDWATSTGAPWGIWGGVEFGPFHGVLCKNRIHVMDHENAWLDATGSLVCLGCRKATEDRRAERLANENREVA